MFITSVICYIRMLKNIIFIPNKNTEENCNSYHNYFMISFSHLHLHLQYIREYS